MIDDTLDDLVFDRDVELLVNELGARPVAEILREIGARCSARTLIHLRVRQYLDRLDRRTLAAVGGARFPSPIVHLVRQ
jgi:hypothetical protein